MMRRALVATSVAFLLFGLAYAEDPPVDPPYEIYDLHTDHLSNVRVVTDESGNIVSQHDLFPFGEEMLPMVGPTNKLFTGHERDKATGLDYMLARYYGNNLPRFLSPDPVNGFTEDPQSWNRCAYARNNPLIVRDPTGEFWDCVVDAIGIGYDIRNLWNEPSWGNAGTLASDVVLGVIPFIPNTGAVRLGFKLLSKGDDALDAIKGARAAGISEDVLEQGGKWLKNWDAGHGVIKAKNGDIILTGVERGGDGKSATRWYKRVGPDGETKGVWHDNYGPDGKLLPGEKGRKVKQGDPGDFPDPESSIEGGAGGPNQYGIDPDGPYGPTPHPCAGKGPMCSG